MLNSELREKSDIFMLRGLPGSGKSTWVKQEFKGRDHIVYSADNFLVKGGRYEWDFKKVGDAHGECLKNFIFGVQHRTNFPETKLIVDNTNLTSVDLAPYIAISKAYCLEFCIVIFDVDSEIAFKRNIHTVPWESYQKKVMLLKNDKMPSYWRPNILYAASNSP